MSIHADHNLYPGVNAHLNSYLQDVGDGMWATFHADYLPFLRVYLDRRLPRGYYALSEKSLQIGEYEGSLSTPSRKIQTIPDITVYRAELASARSIAASEAVAVPPAYTLPLIDVIDEEDKISSVVIYEVQEGKQPGRAVTRIELLSPGNKLYGAHHDQYLSKHYSTIASGICLVEIDLFHLSHPILDSIPSYPKRATNASPYVILVNNTHPTPSVGKTEVYPFGVLDVIPAINIPLANDDTVTVDFGAVYQDVFNGSRLSLDIADYAADPPAFDRFTPQDQQALAAWLAEIRTHDANEEAS